MEEILDRLLQAPPYSLEKAEKRALYREALSRLTRRHYAACPEYRKILDALGFDAQADYEPEEQPMLPVRLFKEYELLRLFLSNLGIVLTREVIMETVWGTDFAGESRTVDMHIKTLRKKLKEAGSLIITVRNVGYKLE